MLRRSGAEPCEDAGVRIDDFIEDDPVRGRRRARTELATAIRRGQFADHEDADVAVPLAHLIHQELTRYGTDGSNEMDDGEMREFLLALRAVVDRLGISTFRPQFRDFTSFRSWWSQRGACGSGGWQARRDLLEGVFGSLHEQLALLEQRSLVSSLVSPATTHPGTGWQGVDTEINELRRHFQNARSEQDYRNIGNDCVAVTESLSRHVYDPARHLRQGETEPPVDKTKQRIERFVEDAAPGPHNAAIRKLARATVELSQEVKHSGSPTRREAGIAADAVIQLANLLRRLADE